MSEHDSAVHVIAVVKGAVEGDPYQHFASLLGFAQHHGAALRAGLVGADGQATPRGHSFYKRHGLATLPTGRANYWNEDTLADAASDIAQFSRGRQMGQPAEAGDVGRGSES